MSVFVIDDDKMMAECIARAAGEDVLMFSNAIEAMNEVGEGVVPELIFLDVLLEGPDGFTFLSELVSYTDTAKIPIVVVSSLDFESVDLSVYGVVGVLNKDTMVPEDIKGYASKYCSE